MNILCLRVRVLPVIRQCKQRAAIFLLFFALLLLSGLWATSQQVQEPAGLQQVSQLRISLSWLGSDARGALLQTLLGCKRRKGGQGQVCLQGIPMQTAETQAEGKISPFTGFVLDYFCF